MECMECGVREVCGVCKVCGVLSWLSSIRKLSIHGVKTQQTSHSTDSTHSTHFYVKIQAFIVSDNFYLSINYKNYLLFADIDLISTSCFSSFCLYSVGDAVSTMQTSLTRSCLCVNAIFRPLTYFLIS